MMLRSMLLICCAGLLAASRSGTAQNMQSIWEPTISHSWKQSDRLSLMSQTSLFASIQDVGTETVLAYGETSMSFTYGWSVRTKLGGGYLFRWSDPLTSDPSFEHRLKEQLAIVRYYGDRRLVHRMRLEQRFKSAGFYSRLRYRLSYDFPLEGERIDTGERYGYLSGEALGMVGKSEFSSETRWRAGIGWVLAPNRKLETGVAYYAENLFAESAVSHVLVFSTAFYLSH